MLVSQVFGLGNRFAPTPASLAYVLRGARRFTGHPLEVLDALSAASSDDAGLSAWHCRLALTRLVDAVSLVDWLNRPNRTRADVLAALDAALALVSPRPPRAPRRGGWRVSRSPFHLSPEEALRPKKPLTLPHPAKSPMPAQLWARPCPTCNRATLPGVECEHAGRGPVKLPAELRGPRGPRRKRHK